MRTIHHKIALRLLPGLCLWLATAMPATRAALPPVIAIPLDEQVLTHLETTVRRLASKMEADPALKKDFRACNDDKIIEGDEPDTISMSIAARHPRLTAALAAEGWKPGDFYLTFAAFAEVPLASKLSHGGTPGMGKISRRNIRFFDHHKARVLAVVEKVNSVLGMTPARD